MYRTKHNIYKTTGLNKRKKNTEALELAYNETARDQNFFRCS
jgi:hypothetical protein